MARSFLPPPSPGTSYPVQSANGRFSEGDAGLLSQVGANMAVSEAQTEGRVPSPLSRAYMFYTALSGESLAMTGNQDEGYLAAEGRRVLREKARATFRGVAAVFALRDALGLTVDLRAVPITQVADPVARVLGPNLNGAPGGPTYWQNVRLFTVRAGSGAAQVLGGLSPLTSFFPAANPPSQALAGVFWYTPPSAQSPTGTWNDPTGVTPTGGTTPLSPTTQGVVRAALAEWVRSVRTDFREDDLLRQGVTREGVALIKAELDAWARDLAGAPAVPGVGVVAGAIGRPPGQEVPAFLEATCVGDALGAVLSDLPLHAGRLVVSSRALGDPTLRVWGALFGAADLGDRAQSLPGSGANLGAALGMGDAAAAVPFVVLDKLFTPRFTLLTQGGVADEWRALAVENHGSTEHALFPFAPELLELLSPDELSGATTARLSSDTLNYVVELQVGDQKVTQLYATSGQGEYALDLEVSADTVDVRLFPNFDLDAVRDVLPTGADGSQPDARYYARVRLGPDWTFGVRALHVDAVDGQRTATTTAAAERRGSKTAGSPGAAPPGEADFFTLDRRPDGFLFEGRGLCLLDLRPPVDPEVNEQTWDVAVDFGTSNTSVAFRPADGSGTARPFPFPVMTTTLLKTPIYGSMGSVNEGHSAVADFFFKLSAEDGDLVSPPQYPNAATPYFPTQIVTRQTELPGGTSDFDLSAGLILFQNGILSGVGLLQILNGFDLQ